jgi:uncharacterized protein
MKFQTVFFNDFGRLRSGWRFAIFMLLFTFSAILLQLFTKAILDNLPNGHSSSGFLSLSAGSFASLALVIFTGWFCGKYLEGLPFRALGIWFTKYWLKDLALGLIFGAAAVSFAILIAAAFGGLSFSINHEAGQSAVLLTLAVSFVVFLFAAAFEEVLFRGYMLQTFARAGLSWFAIALTSIFFGAVHLGNPGATSISTANTMIAGILFSVAYLKTRTLWFVLSLHFIWNWMQGAVFGIEVSGLTDITTAPFLKEFDRGPMWLTGENYGIEGGIACTIALIVFTLLTWFLPILKSSDEMMELTSKEHSEKVDPSTKLA